MAAKRKSPAMRSIAGPQPIPSQVGTLHALRGSLRVDAPAPVLVDVSEYFARNNDGTEHAIVLEWKNPSVAEVYHIGNDAAELRRRNPMWPEQLAVDAATLGACHVAPSPGGLPPGAFYAEIANSGNDKLWYFLVQEFARHFPHLRQNNMQLVDDLMDLCVLYLHRHPDELEHLPSETLTGLRQMAARQRAAMVEG